MMSRFTLAFSIVLCLLLAGPALAQLEQFEMDPPVTAESPLGGPGSITHNLDTSTTSSGVGCGGAESWFRLYDLDAEFGLSGTVCVESVDAVFTSSATANVYCLNDADAFILANLIQVGTNTIPIPGGLGNIAVGGCCDAATQSMAVETGFGTGAGNNNGQTGPSYILCPLAGAFEPTDLADLGVGNFALLQVVNLAVEDVPMLTAWSLAGMLVLLLAGLTVVLARRRFSTVS